jgi:hypothetical protein
MQAYLFDDQHEIGVMINTTWHEPGAERKDGGFK